MQKDQQTNSVDDCAQAIDQCRAVVHMARALAEVHEARALILLQMRDPPVEVIGESSAEIMEWLGDTLDGMDAVDGTEDAWVDPVFERAQVRWPVQSHEHSEPTESGLTSEDAEGTPASSGQDEPKEDSAAGLQVLVPATAEQKLTQAGVFLGEHGLRGLANAQEFWDEQPYGKRLYYGSGNFDYLHLDVLQAAIKLLDASPAAPEAVPVQQPVAWRRLEDGNWIYYATEAWDDLTPLYTHPADSAAKGQE